MQNSNHPLSTLEIPGKNQWTNAPYDHRAALLQTSEKAAATSDFFANPIELQTLRKLPKPLLVVSSEKLNRNIRTIVGPKQSVPSRTRYPQSTFEIHHTALKRTLFERDDCAETSSGLETELRLRRPLPPAPCSELTGNIFEAPVMSSSARSSIAHEKVWRSNKQTLIDNHQVKSDVDQKPTKKRLMVPLKPKADSARESLGKGRVNIFLGDLYSNQSRGEAITCSCYHASLVNSRIKVRGVVSYESSEQDSYLSFVTDTQSSSDVYLGDDFYRRNGLSPCRVIDLNDSVVRKLDFNCENCQDGEHESSSNGWNQCDLSLTSLLQANPLTVSGRLYLEHEIQNVELRDQ
jgi:hypothetical protein